MLKKTLAVIAGTLLTCASFAAEVTLRDDHPTEYTVVEGDTLWGIAKRFLNDPWLWPEIWQANSQIANPHLIFPGDVLSLVYIDGKPRLIKGQRPGVVKLSPKVRDISDRQAVTAIPLEELEPFLEQARVISPADAKARPYVVSVEDSQMYGQSDRVVYVRGLNARAGDEFDLARATYVYREVPKRMPWNKGPAEVVAEPWDSSGALTVGRLWTQMTDWRSEKSEHILGHEVIWVGRGRVIAAGDPAQVLVQPGGEEVKIGDLVLPLERAPYDSTYLPHEPDSVPDNMRVLAVADGIFRSGPMMVVALSRGARDGVANGQVFSIFSPEKEIRDRVKHPDGDLRTLFAPSKGKVTLPEEYMGHVMIFRTFEKVSYGLIMDGVRPVEINAVLRPPRST